MINFFKTSFLGHNGIISRTKLRHVTELDLTDNLLSNWSEIFILLKMFPSLEFLNLSNNLLSEDESSLSSRAMTHGLRKLVLHGNRINWATLNGLTQNLPDLDEIHLSNNSIGNPDGLFSHANVRQLFLTCNNISSFEAVHDNLGKKCPNLQLLSLGENPLTSITEAAGGFNNLFSLNLNITKITNFADLDKLRSFPRLTELRLKHCPILEEFTAHERRMIMIAKLPNVLILNGGDRIPDNEREDAERSFIRFYLDEEVKPKR
jgi:Leucine-rich repeat (LRR) protein